MSTETVALAMIQKKRLDPMDKDVLVFFKKAAITALRHQEGRRLAKNTGRSEDGVMLLWELV